MLLSEDITAIDLLPEFLGEDKSKFRFSLSPWHRAQGSWQQPEDIAKDLQQHRPMLDHIREVIARSRATPQLKHWQIGLQVASDDSKAFQKGFQQLTEHIEQMIRLYDGRPLIHLHPEAVPFDQTAVSKIWGKSPIGEFIPYLGGGTTWKYTYATDQSLWDIHRQRLTIDRSGLNDEASGFSLYAWMIDEYHRYYQQRVGYMNAATGRQVVYVDWDQSAAWEAVGHQIAWDQQRKRRVRKIGLQIIADKQLAKPKSLTFTLANAIDQIAPPQALDPLIIEAKQAPAAQIAAWERFEVHFDLNHGVDNPYDPQQANVFAEIKNPAGEVTTFPAFWYEPMTVADKAGSERVAPNGRGYWLWRYSFDHAGTWQVRLNADLRNAEGQRQATGQWQTVTVTQGGDNPLLPVSQSDDPRYWQTSDGKWFYPMGITIRSPGIPKSAMKKENSSQRSEDWEQPRHPCL